RTAEPTNPAARAISAAPAIMPGMVRRRDRMARLRAILAAVCLSSLAGVPAFASSNPCEAEIMRAAQRHGVPEGILYAVGLSETGRRGSLHPNALNIAGRAVFARNAREALREFESARQQGVRLIDLGCMQINYHYHAE